MKARVDADADDGGAGSSAAVASSFTLPMLSGRSDAGAGIAAAAASTTALPMLSARSGAATAAAAVGSVAEQLRGTRFQQLRNKFLEAGAIAFVSEEERVSLPAATRNKRRTATDRRWDVALHDVVGRQRITAAERAETAKGRVVSGYVGAMMSHVGLAAVQEEAMVAMCHAAKPHRCSNPSAFGARCTT